MGSLVVGGSRTFFPGRVSFFFFLGGGGSYYLGAQNWSKSQPNFSLMFFTNFLKNKDPLNNSGRSWPENKIVWITVNIIYIMQSSLPTTIYVQNLSFFVTQILIPITFFLFGRFTWYLCGIWTKCVTFWPHKKKRKKGNKRGKFEILWKSQNFEKNIIFLKVYPLSTSFTLCVFFCKQ